jgi:adenine-specific DNA-methyltransferase
VYTPYHSKYWATALTLRGAGADQWPNLTLKKIPNAVKDRCEWGRDDYSLSISNLPPADATDSDNEPSPSPTSKKGAGAKKPKTAGQADLFTDGEPA